MNDNPECVVEQVVGAAINDALESAEAQLLERFGAVRLSDLAEEFDRICAERGWERGKAPPQRP